ncbi:activator-dependent family glycosyltransferase [Solwaraspora sp. WMMD1047]|uniref:activator-dependent family glycosyltransferase n=1 Tax=Solwaraspora sp. WMMD1047 TaxID=3016102 RepID=UPI002415DBAA|nr:activator-dependent family glycosyltransferase [Solwaraspora sp. WMMD1047]MDG4827800.1 activator-dependent family glycosyltransferase [Solwaraspora sp. WMMD1047]
MRVLFTAYAEKTHFMSMVPLAWALQTAGHEVRVMSHPELTEVITGAGLTAVPVSRDHPLYRVKRMETSQRLDVPLLDLADRDLGRYDWADLRDGYRHLVPWWWRMVNDPMIADVTEFCLAWKPDLVLWEPITYAGAVGATASGAVHARVMWSVDVFARMRRHFRRLHDAQPPGEREDVLARWLGSRVARFGAEFSEVLTTGHFTVDTIPDSLRHDPALGLELDLRYLPTRYVPYNGRSAVPSWLRQRRSELPRPRVALTLGTTATERFDGYAVSVADLLDALADLDVEVVATLPQREQEALGRVPANVRLVTFAPLNALAATCSVVINHGGPGTLFTTALHSVPQLVVPNMFDEPLLAGWLAGQGAGLAIPRTEATGPRVREAVRRLLDDPALAAGARGLRAQMLAMPAPNDVVPELEKLTELYRDEARGR